jgi:RNA polymerase sigma-70 factor (ECF subfamily)
MLDADVAAMQRLAAGDDIALNEIMSRWQQRVASFLRRMTGCDATACDLAQETFVRLYLSRGRYKPGASFASYLFRICTNLARNHHRWIKRHPSEPLEALQEAGVEPASGVATPDAVLSEADTVQAVKRALQQLPADLREPLVLFTYEEMSYADIAAVLDCSAKAVETRIYRARQFLKGKLAHLSGLVAEQ